MSNKRSGDTDKFIKFKRRISQNRFLRAISGCPYMSPIWDKKISKLINDLGEKARILDLGSGVRKRANHIINLEVDIMPNVDIVADGHILPFKDAVFNMVILEAVLEHVKEPKLIISEVKRILRKGGYICVAVPFIQGYHASPTDYQRYTIQGLENMLSDFERMESGSCVGPTSAFHWIFREYIGILISFGNFWIYKLVSLIVGWLTFPIVFLDLLLKFNKNSDNISSAVFFIGKVR